MMFGGIDFMIGLSGASRVQHLSCCKRISLLFLRTFFVYAALHFLFYHIYKTPAIPGQELPSHLTAILQLLCVIIVLWTLERSHALSEKIRVKVRCVMGGDGAMAQKFRWTSFILCYLYLVTCACTAALSMKLNNDSVKNYFYANICDVAQVTFLHQIVVAILCSSFESLLRQNWIIMSAFLYGFYMHLIESCDLIVMQSIIDRKQSFKFSFNQINMMQNMKLSFESAFSILPFLWFLFLFADCFVVAWNHVHPPAIQVDNTYTGIAYAINVAICAIIASQATALKVRLEKKVESVIRQLEEGVGLHADEHHILLIRELRRRSQFSYTGWGVFTLSRGFLVTFVETLASMAVLFFQITSS
jgi:hypothetical protein